MPLASFPLMALAQQSADSSMQADNPYAAAALIFIVGLAVPAALIAYFRLQRRGRVIAAVIFSVLDWMVTVPIVTTAGLSLYASVAIASVSAAVLAFAVIRFGAHLSGFFRLNNSSRSDADRD